MDKKGAGTITQAMHAGSLLRISVTRNKGSALVCLDGRLTIDSSPALRDQLLAILHGETLQDLTVDLSDVPYMDLSGVATLLETLKVARGRNTGLRLKGLHDRPRYLLEVTGLLSLFETGGVNLRSIQKA
jgi:anti-sigma B factor antagonist